MKRITRNTQHAARALFILGVLFIAFLATRIASAQTATPPTVTDDMVNAIAKRLYCPVCENIPLDVCPTQACAEWRELIRQKLAAGWTEKQIIDYFVEQYGDRVLGTPPARGLNWLVYLFPPVAILAGALILYRAFHAWRKPAPQAAAPSPAPEAPTDEYVRRLEEELRKNQ